MPDYIDNETQHASTWLSSDHRAGRRRRDRRPLGRGRPANESQPAPTKQLPKRSEVKPSDTWDLSSLFPNDQAWEEAFAAWQKRIEGYAAFSGQLAESPEKLAACLQFDLDVDRAGDRLGTYAMLKTAEDQSNSVYQRMQGRFTQAASRAGQASSYIRPEILAIASAKMDEYLQAPALAPYKLLLTRILRFKPHTLSEKEEKLLAMQTEMAQAAEHIFRQLNDTDIKFGTVKNEKGQPIELSHATFSVLLYSPDRDVRAKAFHTYYQQYTAHEHTLAASFERLGRARRVLCQGPQLPLRAGGGPVSRSGAGGGVRQLDRLDPPAAPRVAPLLRRAAADDETRPDSPIRHLRADPGADAEPAHLGRGGQNGVDRLGTAGSRIRPRARSAG